MLRKRTTLWLALMLALLFSSIGTQAQENAPSTTDLLAGNAENTAQENAPAGVSVQSTGGGFLYALQDVTGGPNQIYGFRVNEVTGALTLLTGFPIFIGGNGSGFTVSEQMAYDSVNARLYVLNEGSDSVSAYSVNLSSGALTALAFSPINLGDGLWNCLAVRPGGSVLVAGDADGTPALASFSVTGSGATPAAGNPYSTGTAFPYSYAFSRDGNHVYAGGGTGNTLAGFSVNAATGALTSLSGSPFESGAANPLAYATDSSGRLFMANLAGGARVFTTSGGVPSPVAGNPFASGLTGAVHGVLHPAGYYLVADRVGNRVGVYRINNSGASTTLTAVSGSPFASGGSYTNILAFNRSSAFLFAANGFSCNITSYAVDAATGEISGVATLPVGSTCNSNDNPGATTGMAYVPGLNIVFLPLTRR